MAEASTTGVIRVTLRDGLPREFPAGTTIQAVAEAIGPGLGKACVGGRIDGDPGIQDLRTPLDRDVRLEIITADSEAGLEVIRHSAAHILAEALLRLWPDTRLAIGPATGDGFYYDVDLAHRLSAEDFPAIEAEMRRIVDEDTPFERCPVDREAEIRRADAARDSYKAEILRSIPAGEEVTFYRHGRGRFEDLCRGPHVPRTGYVKAFKLLRVAGAYWRGDERNPMLQRIYGTAYHRLSDLEAHLHRLEEAERRDHRRLGRELGFFMLHSSAPASPFFLPRGAIVYNRLQQMMRDLYRRHGYQEVITPQIFDASLWHTSGHYEQYHENMYFTRIDERECAVKPMNCPAHALIYAMERRSYRELPLRLADFGRLHRHERSGVTSGLTRVRTFCQDDAHIFVALEQVQAEVGALFAMIREVYGCFRFPEIRIGLGTRPRESIGGDEEWRSAEAALARALEAAGTAYDVHPGDGAFYGPKIDFQVQDAIGRPWQLGTIQLDFNLPERFDLRYTAADGQDRRPVVIHRAILGSVERFLGILIEHYAGAFPFWLAPEQARILTISDEHAPRAREVQDRLVQAGFRVGLDAGSERTGAKIRAARLMRIPFVLVVGAKEVEAGTVSVREHPDMDRGALGVESVLALFQERETSLS
jgi:threonyl-tRNA synthetase